MDELLYIYLDSSEIMCYDVEECCLAIRQKTTTMTTKKKKKKKKFATIYAGLWKKDLFGFELTMWRLEEAQK